MVKKRPSKSEISALLYQKWDPLALQNISPPDEYDEYAEELRDIIFKGATIDRIFSYLAEVRVIKLMVDPDPVRDRSVAELIERAFLVV